MHTILHYIDSYFVTLFCIFESSLLPTFLLVCFVQIVNSVTKLSPDIFSVPDNETNNNSGKLLNTTCNPCELLCFVVCICYSNLNRY
jgi:hypothetical protein